MKKPRRIQGGVYPVHEVLARGLRDVEPGIRSVVRFCAGFAAEFTDAPVPVASCEGHAGAGLGKKVDGITRGGRTHPYIVLGAVNEEDVILIGGSLLAVFRGPMSGGIAWPNDGVSGAMREAAPFARIWWQVNFTSRKAATMKRTPVWGGEGR
ncbi:MAG: hypothetical protein ABID40_03140 [Candidatus Bipolaricaulota bacterium]